MLFYNSDNTEGFLIDGVTSEQEKRMQPATDTWCIVTRPQGPVMNRSFWIEEFLEQVPDINIFYTDDIEKSHPPEKDSGQIGRVSSIAEVKSLRAGKYFIGIEFYWPPFFHASGEQGSLNRAVIQQYLDYQDSPLEFRVGELRGVSRTRPVPPKK